MNTNSSPASQVKQLGQNFSYHNLTNKSPHYTNPSLKPRKHGHGRWYHMAIQATSKRLQYNMAVITQVQHGYSTPNEVFVLPSLKQSVTLKF